MRAWRYLFLPLSLLLPLSFLLLSAAVPLPVSSARAANGDNVTGGAPSLPGSDPPAAGGNAAPTPPPPSGPAPPAPPADNVAPPEAPPPLVAPLPPAPPGTVLPMPEVPPEPELPPPAPATDNVPPARTITIREAVETALRNNIDVAVSRTEKEIGAAGIDIEAAAFLPRFTGEFDASRAISPSTSSVNQAFEVDQKTYKLDLGAQELFPTGTTLSLDFLSQRQDLSSGFTLLSPAYTTGLTLSAVQPLLKNRGRTATEAPLFIARAEASARAGDWTAKVMDIVASARSAYLTLVAALRTAEVRRTALSLAERLLAQVNARINAGAAAPIDRLPAEAAVAARRVDLIAAETAARNAEDDLKNVMGIRTAASMAERLAPVPFEEDAAPPGPEQTFEEAMRRRPEVQARDFRIAQADRREAVARNGLLPTLDLTVAGGLSGLAGASNPNRISFGPADLLAADRFSGSYGDSLDEMLSGRFYNWFVGVRTEIPWRFERERAALLQAQLTAKEQRLLQEGLALSILLEFQKARRDLESGLARVDASRVSVESALKKMEAEERKLALGRSTVYQVLQFQQDAQEAQLTLVQARTDAFLAQTRLWRATGTILDRQGIVIR